jgi:hypothetical protein
METKNPVPEFYYSPDEWDRLGCGPLPPERDLSRQQPNNQENKDETNTDN